MRITVSLVDSDIPIENDLIPLDVFPDMTLDDVKALIEGDTNIPSNAQHFFVNGKILNDSKQTLERLEVREGDMLGLAVRDPQKRGPAPETQSRNTGKARRGPDTESLRLQLIGDPRIRAEIRQTAPELADAADNKERFHELFNEHQRKLAQAQAEKEARLAALNADPFNVEAQKEIEEMIRMERVQDNIQEALEHNPEMFGRVTMLYIPVTVNGVPVKAFVDSGAQATIMSPSCAERTNIMRLIDRRYAGIAKGVGTAAILGRVHSAEIQIGKFSLPSSFTVMEGKDVDLLLGLDMLKRHQMDISLRENCLKIHDDKIPFLPESEIPKSAEEAMADEPKIEGPGGMKVGARSGAVEVSSKAATPGPSSLASRPSGSGSSQQQVHPGISVEAVSKITELGFTKEEAIQALSQVGGDVELAIGLLL